MRPHRSVWLWLIVVALVLLVAFAVSYELAGSAAAGWPWWVWGLLGAAVFIFAIGLIFMIVAFVREGQQTKAFCAELARGQAAAPAHGTAPNCHTPQPAAPVAPQLCPQTGKKLLTALQYC